MKNFLLIVPERPSAEFPDFGKALPSLFEKNGLMSFDVAGSAVLLQPERLGRYDAVVVAKLPEEIWNDAMAENLRNTGKVVVVEGPLPVFWEKAWDLSRPSSHADLKAVIRAPEIERRVARQFGLERVPEFRFYQRNIEERSIWRKRWTARPSPSRLTKKEYEEIFFSYWMGLKFWHNRYKKFYGEPKKDALVFKALEILAAKTGDDLQYRNYNSFYREVASEIGRQASEDPAGFLRPWKKAGNPVIRDLAMIAEHGMSKGWEDAESELEFFFLKHFDFKSGFLSRRFFRKIFAKLSPGLATLHPETRLVLFVLANVIEPEMDKPAGEAGLFPISTYEDHAGFNLCLADVAGGALVLEKGGLFFSSFPIFSYLIYHQQFPELQAAYYRHDFDYSGLIAESFLVELLSERVSRDSAVVCIRPWPGAKANAICVRHDVDRVPSGTDLRRLTQYEKETGLRSTWFFKSDLLDRSTILKVRDAGFETALHVVHLSRFTEEREALQRLAGPVSGVTSHGGPGADGWLGATSLNRAYQDGFRYADTFGMHLYPVWHVSAGEVKRILCMANSVGIDSLLGQAEKVEGAAHESVDWLVRGGGCLIFSNHPDINFENFTQWIGKYFKQDSFACLTYAELAEWWFKTHNADALKIELRDDGVELYSETDIEDLGIEIHTKSGRSRIVTHLKKGRNFLALDPCRDELIRR